MLIIDTVAAITTMHVICIVIVPIKKLNYPLYLDDDVFTLLQCPSDTINKAKFMKYTGLGTFLFAFYTLTCYKCYTTKYSFPVTTGKGKNAKPVADQPCWFDLKRNDCAKCKPGGVQCGAPMEKVTTQCICICDCICSCVCKLYLQWCQSKKSKTGCPGIPQFKYTRSSTGFPCYWDPKR